MSRNPVQSESAAATRKHLMAMDANGRTERFVEEGEAFSRLAGLEANGSAAAATAAAPRGSHAPERVPVIVIGAGQAGLSVGYHLARRGVRFVILDAGERVGDQWRRRWDSLRLFTPARYDGLDGMSFPDHRDAFPTKDAMADYLEAYAARFSLPVRTRTRVDGLSRRGDRFIVRAGERTFETEQVVVAMASYQRPKLPAFASQLAPEVVQLHSSDYRNPSQLEDGGVLIVGAGNSGSEIALELARHGYRTWLSGRDTGHIPFRIDGVAARYLLVQLVLRVVFHRILTTDTPIGRKVRPEAVSKGGPLIRVKPKQLAAAAVERVPRIAGVRDGRPVLEDGRALDVSNVIWCTGYHPAFSWMDLDIFDEHGEPRHERGVVGDVPGLYFVGLHFLYAMSSTMIHGVGRDANFIAGRIAARVKSAV